MKISTPNTSLFHSVTMTKENRGRQYIQSKGSQYTIIKYLEYEKKNRLLRSQSRVEDGLPRRKEANTVSIIVFWITTPIP